MWERRGAYRVLKSEEKEQLGGPRRRLEENIIMDHQEVKWGAWIGLIWLRIGTVGGHMQTR
jgi:hypothetical protein